MSKKTDTIKVECMALALGEVIKKYNLPEAEAFDFYSMRLKELLEEATIQI